MSAKVSPQILLRLRPRIVGLNEGRGWWGYVSLSLFRALRETSRHFGHGGGFGCCSAVFLLMDEKTLVFAGVHTRPISA